MGDEQMKISYLLKKTIKRKLQERKESIAPNNTSNEEAFQIPKISIEDILIEEILDENLPKYKRKKQHAGSLPDLMSVANCSKGFKLKSSSSIKELRKLKRV